MMYISMIYMSTQYSQCFRIKQNYYRLWKYMYINCLNSRKVCGYVFATDYTVRYCIIAGWLKFLFENSSSILTTFIMNCSLFLSLSLFQRAWQDADYVTDVIRLASLFSNAENFIIARRCVNCWTTTRCSFRSVRVIFQPGDILVFVRTR